MKLEAIEIGALALCLTLVSGSSIASAGFSSDKSVVIEKALDTEEPKLVSLATKPFTVESVATLDDFLGAEVKISPLEAPVAKKSGQFSEQDLIDVLKSVGFQGRALKEAWAVAMKESTGRPKAHNDNPSTGDNSYGLFQINMRGSLGPDRLQKYGLSRYKDLFDPYINATVAYQMSEGGKNWGPWGIGPDAYNGGTTGSYYKWLEQYPGE
jgi:hypothetical protein